MCRLQFRDALVTIPVLFAKSRADCLRPQMGAHRHRKVTASDFMIVGHFEDRQFPARALYAHGAAIPTVTSFIRSDVVTIHSVVIVILCKRTGSNAPEKRADAT